MTNKLFKTLSFSYILLPLIIFFFGWLKLLLDIPLCIALLIIFLRIIHNEQSEQLHARRLSFQDLIPVIAIILLCVYFSGIGGLGIVGCLLLQVDFASLEHFMHIEWWSGFQFSSFTTQLFGGFNQAIYAWVLTLLIMRQKSNRYIVFEVVS